MTKKERLNEVFRTAINNGYNYVGIVIEMSGFPSKELIINNTENFERKLEYYNNAYDDDLVLRSFNGIKIVDVELACSIEDFAIDFDEYGFGK